MPAPRHFHERPNRDGSIRLYWRPSASLRKLGFRDRRLSDDRSRALAECEAHNREVDRYRLTMAQGVFDRARPGTLRHLIAAYKAHDDYLLLAPSTRRDYGHRLEIIALRIGDARTRELKPRVVQALKRSFAATPSQANHVLRVFRLLCSFAVREGIMADNPALAFRQYRERPRRQLWRHDQERRFLEVCGPDLALVYLLAVYTAQRQGDLLALPWSAYDGEVIRLEQGKTGALLEIPVAARLARVLAETPRAGPMICTREPCACPAAGRPARSACPGRPTISATGSPPLARPPASRTGASRTCAGRRSCGSPKPAARCRRSPAYPAMRSTTAPASSRPISPDAQPGPVGDHQARGPPAPRAVNLRRNTG